MNDRAPIIGNETCFFRGHGQFDLLPELIERRRDAKPPQLFAPDVSDFKQHQCCVFLYLEIEIAMQLLKGRHAC